MNKEIDVKIERILAIKEILSRLIEAHMACASSARLDWFEKKIDSLLEELKHED